jgi:lipid II:glycine glycyltransferase (peptidoglycan interpeptide bridge formation enzyme)
MASVQLRKVGPAREAYIPRGPVPATPEALDGLIAWARNESVARLVVEPEAPEELKESLTERGFARTAPTQPQHTRIIELGPLETTLSRFDHRTRYNIRLAERRGVMIEEGADATELARQSKRVEERTRITLPGREYYALLLALLPQCRTYVARDPDSEAAIAALLCARHDGRGYNLFAGRSGARRDLKSNELLHWTAMRRCLDDGIRDYDLWGVPPPGADPGHPWHGLGQFKAGFDGELVTYAGAWELVLSPSGANVLALERMARARIRGLKRNIP